MPFNFFIPTSGWNEIDRFGRFSANWRLREQQVDFLLSYFEHWEQLKEYNLVIGFCDESPVLDEIVEQIYDCMNLYNIPKDSVMIMGHNFLGQNTINALCQERKELPILKVSYDFSRLPDELSLSKDKNIIEYAFYKYKPMLERANQFIKQRRVRDALNYYKVVMSQNIPPEFKAMIRKNINDLTDDQQVVFGIRPENIIIDVRSTSEKNDIPIKDFFTNL